MRIKSGEGDSLRETKDREHKDREYKKIFRRKSRGFSSTLQSPVRRKKSDVDMMNDLGDSVEIPSLKEIGAGGLRERSGSQGNDNTEDSDIPSPNTSPSAPSNIDLKFVFGDDTPKVTVSRGITIDTLRDLVKEEYGVVMSMKYKDAEGNYFPIKKTRHIREALSQWNEKGALKIYVSEPKEGIGDTDILDTLPNAVIMISNHGTIMLFNSAAEQLFGHTRQTIISKNVTILMPTDAAEKHTQYIHRYLDGSKDVGNKDVGHQVGGNQIVIAKHKDGTMFPVQISVTASKSKGRPVFIGILRKPSVGDEKILALLDKMEHSIRELREVLGVKK